MTRDYIDGLESAEQMNDSKGHCEVVIRSMNNQKTEGAARTQKYLDTL